MGMYDTINFKMKCPRCKRDMGEFQSKDGPQGLFVLEFYEVNNFYAFCDHCKTWVEFTLKERPNRKLDIKDYKKEVKKTTKKDDIEKAKNMKKFKELFK